MQPGQHVLCIRGGPTKNKSIIYNYPQIIWPKKGVVYTLRDVFPHPNKSHMGCLLEEINNCLVKVVSGEKVEAFFNTDRFRPLSRLTPESFLDIKEPLSA